MRNILHKVVVHAAVAHELEEAVVVRVREIQQQLAAQSEAKDGHGVEAG